MTPTKTAEKTSARRAVSAIEVTRRGCHGHQAEGAFLTFNTRRLLLGRRLVARMAQEVAQGTEDHQRGQGQKGDHRRLHDSLGVEQSRRGGHSAGEEQGDEGQGQAPDDLRTRGNQPLQDGADCGADGFNEGGHLTTVRARAMPGRDFDFFPPARPIVRRRGYQVSPSSKRARQRPALPLL